MKKGKPFDVKKVIAGFTIDVIATTSFAMDTDSNGATEKENPFLFHGLSLFKPNLLKLLTVQVIPTFLQKFLNIRGTNDPVHLNFFINTMKTIIDERKRKGIRRNDLTQSLIDAKQSDDDLKNVKWNDLTATGEDDSGMLNLYSSS